MAKRPKPTAAEQPDGAPYQFTPHERRAIATALRALEKTMRRDPIPLGSPSAAKTFLKLKLAALKHEVFAVIFVDAQIRLIAYEEIFRGTLSQTAVYPREVVKRALELGAGGVLLAHNHPSNWCEPSQADIALTQTLKVALTMVDVNVLDHIIIAGTEHYSFAERGRLND